MLGAFLLKAKHLLSSLITLEFLGLVVFFSLCLLFLRGGGSIQMLIALVSIIGCESVLGLVLFVFLSRVYRKDYFLTGGGTRF